MKVESNKTNNQIPNENRTSVSNFKESETNFTLDNRINSTNSNNQKDFALILKGTSVQNEYRLDNPTKNTSHDNKIEKEDINTSKSGLDSKDVKEKEKGKSDSDQEEGFGNNFTHNITNSTEINNPGSRAILHIADLERIISSIRSQTFADSKQVLIELKHSVLQGLELKLTIGKDKGIIAEFIAANESIKNQLNAKAEELATILRNRGVKLTGLSVSLGSESNDRRNQHSFGQEIDSISKKVSNQPRETDLENSEISNTHSNSDTSYHI